MGKVYFFTNGNNIKIGYTKGDITKRLKQLNTGSDAQLYCLGYITGNKLKEKELHQYFSKYKIRNNGEWFYSSLELIEYINKFNERPNTYVEKNEYLNQVMTFLKT